MKVKVKVKVKVTVKVKQFYCLWRRTKKWK